MQILSSVWHTIFLSTPAVVSHLIIAMHLKNLFSSSSGQCFSFVFSLFSRSLLFSLFILYSFRTKGMAFHFGSKYKNNSQTTTTTKIIIYGKSFGMKGKKAAARKSTEFYSHIIIWLRAKLNSPMTMVWAKMKM